MLVRDHPNVVLYHSSLKMQFKVLSHTKKLIISDVPLTKFIIKPFCNASEAHEATYSCQRIRSNLYSIIYSCASHITVTLHIQWNIGGDHSAVHTQDNRENGWDKQQQLTSASSRAIHQSRTHGHVCGCQRQEQFYCHVDMRHTGHGRRPVCRADYHPGPHTKHTTTHTSSSSRQCTALVLSIPNHSVISSFFWGACDGTACQKYTSVKNVWFCSSNPHRCVCRSESIRQKLAEFEKFKCTVHDHHTHSNEYMVAQKN